MLTLHPGESTAVLIDGPNSSHTMKMVGWQIDFDRLRAHFNANADLVDLCYFTALKKNKDRVHGLTHYLKNHGYAVVTRAIGHGDDHGDMISEIKERATAAAMTCDHIVLFSGSGRLADLVMLIQQSMGRRVTIISTPSATAARLQLVADAVVDVATLHGALARVDVDLTG